MLKTRKADIILLAGLLVAAAILGAAMYLPRSGGETVVISVNNEVYGEYPLSRDTTVSLPRNTVRVEDGRVWMSAADCPDGLCKKSGKISRRGETIICAPNRVLVEIR